MSAHSLHTAEPRQHRVHRALAPNAPVAMDYSPHGNHRRRRAAEEPHRRGGAQSGEPTSSSNDLMAELGPTQATTPGGPRGPVPDLSHVGSKPADSAWSGPRRRWRKRGSEEAERRRNIRGAQIQAHRDRTMMNAGQWNESWYCR
jgi:hypothetical protein